MNTFNVIIGLNKMHFLVDQNLKLKLKQWKNNKDFEMWFEPKNGKWGGFEYEKPIIINENGDEIDNKRINAYTYINDNLSDEDKAAQTILGALKGKYIRNYIDRLKRFNVIKQ